MPHDEARANVSQPGISVYEDADVSEHDAFVDHIFHELSQPVSALWCALELAAMRAPDAEEDRQDLLAAFAVVEELGRKVRNLQAEANARFRHYSVEILSKS